MGFEAFVPLITSVLGTALSAKGSSDSADASIESGEFTAQSYIAQGDYAAKQLRVNAGQDQAAAQVAAGEERRKYALLQSKALAFAAASGGGAVDPTVLKIISGLAGDGSLAVRSRLYAGDESARGKREQANAAEYNARINADATRRGAKNAADYYKTKGIGTVLSGAKSAYDAGGFNFGTDSGFDGAQYQPGNIGEGGGFISDGQY